MIFMAFFHLQDNLSSEYSTLVKQYFGVPKMGTYRLPPFFFFLMSVQERIHQQVQSPQMEHRKLLYHSSLSHFQGRHSTSLLKVSVVKLSTAACALPAWSNIVHTAAVTMKNTSKTVYIRLCLSRKVTSQGCVDYHQGRKLWALVQILLKKNAMKLIMSTLNTYTW